MAEAIEQGRESQQTAETLVARRQAIARWRILELLRERLVTQLINSDSTSDTLDRLATEVAGRQRDPYSAVEELISK